MISNSYTPKNSYFSQRNKAKEIFSSIKTINAEQKIIYQSLKKPSHSKSKSYGLIHKEDKNSSRLVLGQHEDNPLTER